MKKNHAGLKADELVEWLFSREEMISGMNMEMADLRLKYPVAERKSRESGCSIQNGRFQSRDLHPMFRVFL